MVEPALKRSSLTISSMIGAGKFAHVYSGVLSGVPAGVKKQIHSINDDRDAATVARYVRTEAAVMRECGMLATALANTCWKGKAAHPLQAQKCTYSPGLAPPRGLGRHLAGQGRCKVGQTQ